MSQATVVRLESSEEVVSYLRSEEVEKSFERRIWVKDKDALHSLDPHVVEWIVSGLFSVLPVLISWLANRAREAQAPITVEVREVNVTIEIPPDMSDQGEAAAVQRITKAIEGAGDQESPS